MLCVVGARRCYASGTLETTTDELRKLITAARLPVQLTSPPLQRQSPTLYLFMSFEVMTVVFCIMTPCSLEEPVVSILR